MQDRGWLDRYIEVWLGHVAAGGPDGAVQLARLVAAMTTDVVYEDVPSGARFTGHDGIARMARGAYQMSSDLAFEIGSRQTDGRSFAFETVGHGTNTGAIASIASTGKRFTLRGVSIGTVTADGLVSTQRDYWDMASFLGQLGVRS
jgi:predicted ester cyclase